MSEKIKDRAIGVFVTALTAVATFLTTQYFFSFQTKAESLRDLSSLKTEFASKLNVLEKNQKSIICYLDKTKCL